MFEKAIEILGKYHIAPDGGIMGAYLEVDLTVDEKARSALLQELHDAGYYTLVAPDNSIIISGSGKANA
jgi:hypothetical protein